MSSLRDRTLGLLQYDKPIALIFHTRFGIHTFGLKYPIDVIILNKDGKVVKIRENLQPNRIFLWNPRYAKVIELPEETIRRLKTKVGDQLSLM